MEFDAVAVRVGHPGLVALVAAELDVAHVHAALPQGGDSGLDVVHFQADVAVGLTLGLVAQFAFEEFDEVPPAHVEIDAHAAPVPVELKGLREAQLVPVECQGAVQVGDGEAGVRQIGDHVVLLIRLRWSMAVWAQCCR